MDKAFAAAVWVQCLFGWWDNTCAAAAYPVCVQSL